MEKAPAEPNEVDSSVSRSDDGGAEAAQPGPLPEGKKSDALPTANDIGSIPNGGLVAWLQVLGSFVLFVNSWYVYYGALLPGEVCGTTARGIVTQYYRAQC